MKTVQIRKQGGAAIMTIPSDFMRLLHLEIGSVISLDVQEGQLTAKPTSLLVRKKYSTSELLANVTPEALKELNKELEDGLSGKAFGREL